MPHIYNIGIKAVILNPDKDKVLFLKSVDNKKQLILTLPGGRMEKGESIEICLKRELKEEILNLSSFKILDILAANPRSFDLEGGIGLFLLAIEVETLLELPILESEHKGYEWLSITDLQRDIPLIVNGAKMDNEMFKSASITALKKYFK